jgi:hypothetical protein
MNRLTTLPISRTPRLVERSIAVAAPRDSKGNVQADAAGKPEAAMSRFLTTLLHSLSAAAA